MSCLRRGVEPRACLRDVRARLPSGVTGSPCWIYYRIIGGDVYILHVRRAESLFRIECLDDQWGQADPLTINGSFGSSDPFGLVPFGWSMAIRRSSSWAAA